MISLIVAVSDNGVIGVDGDLPWRLPDDLKHFKQLTTGKPVLMGRKTFESIGRPLPDRHNIVITRNAAFTAAGCDIASSPEAAVAMAGDVPEIMVIGGGSIYERFADSANRIYLTKVHTSIDGDAFFRELDERIWLLTASENHPADARHEHAFDFLEFDRR